MADVTGVAVPVEALLRVVAGVFRAIGSPTDEADVIAEELVRADQMGLGSHGSVRVGDYVEIVESGRVKPGGACSIVTETSGSALIDGGMNFGQVVGRFVLDVGARKAHDVGVACVVTRETHHFGRLGSLMERAADRDLIAIATVAVNLPGPVAPWGAAEGVLGTNPFAYGVPLEGRPAVTDFATSTIAESVVLLAHRAGRAVPDDMILDAAGEPTNDPGVLSSQPRGALLPFGGPVGYKGYALNLLPELTAAALAGYGPDFERPSNCLLLVLIDPSVFLPIESFKELAGASAALVKGAQPRRGEQVLLPGERELDRLTQQPTLVTVAEPSLTIIRATAALLSVDTEGLR